MTSRVISGVTNALQVQSIVMIVIQSVLLFNMEFELFTNAWTALSEVMGALGLGRRGKDIKV